MSPFDLLKMRGEEHCEALSRQAGTSLGYFKQIAYGFRRPSPELARRLADASGGDLDAVELAFAVTRESGDPQPARAQAA